VESLIDRFLSIKETLKEEETTELPMDEQHMEGVFQRSSQINEEVRTYLERGRIACAKGFKVNACIIFIFIVTKSLYCISLYNIVTKSIACYKDI
jgi:hypothetical protein